MSGCFKLVQVMSGYLSLVQDFSGCIWLGNASPE